MRLVVKRAHMPYPGVRLPAGMEMVVEPDTVAQALIERGWFGPALVSEPIKEKKFKKGS